MSAEEVGLAFPPRDPDDDEQLVELAANYLLITGWLEDVDEEVLDELRQALKHHGGCIVARGDVYCRDAEQLAHCWADDRRREYEREGPRFECPCGVNYGWENSGYSGGYAFFALAEDGTLRRAGERVPVRARAHRCAQAPARGRRYGPRAAVRVGRARLGSVRARP
jgi:hypothetical protein